MKKLISLAALTLTCLSVWADPVDRAAAKLAAKQFLQARGVDMTEQKPVHRAPRKGKAEQKDSYYYVFNADNDQGFVIVSGDSRTEEILGYVDHGTYCEGTVPEQMKSWLQAYADEIQSLDEHGIKATPARQRAAARHRLNSTKHAVAPLMSTTWNQGDPYNTKCPNYYRRDGSTAKPATGCVATALAQVMNFYKYPKRTMADIPAISNTYQLSNGQQKTVNTKPIRRFTKLEWDKMQDHYTGNEPQEQIDAVANLMLYVGQSVHMAYGASSGASFNSYAARMLTDYFNYAKGAYIAYRTDYSIDGWYNLLYDEIATGHPVGFTGRSTGGAHAFVIDGYDGENMFHLNWGWGGQCDGWFLLTSLNPGDNTGIGASMSKDGYDLGQSALINVRLPDGEKAEPATSLTINNIAIEGTSIKAKYINWTGATDNFDAAVVYENEKGEIVPVGGRYENFSLNNNNATDRSFNVRKLLPVGTWKLSPASKVHSAKTWHPVLNMRDNYIEAVVGENQSITLRFVEPNVDLCVEEVICAGTGEVGSEQELQVKFANHGDEFLKELKLFASTSETKANVYSYAMVGVKKGETATYAFYYRPTQAGVHNLWFCTDDNGNNVVAQGQITIAEKNQGERLKLVAASFDVGNAVGDTIIYGQRLCGTLTVRNDGDKPFCGNLMMHLHKEPGGVGILFGSTTLYKHVEVAAGDSCLVPFNYTDIEYGGIYHIQVKAYGRDIEKGGVWERRWTCKEGIILWKNDGGLAAMETVPSLITSDDVCALLLDRTKVETICPNQNPNTIYAITQGTAIPTGLAGHNLVIADSAQSISLCSGQPYCVPYTFTAHKALFTHTFPEENNRKGWQTITLPFAADSISVAGKGMVPGDTLNHCWIYEFAWTEDDGTPVFTPTLQLRANTPYIIAADSSLAGQTIEFHATDASIYGTDESKAIINSQNYKQMGTTVAKSMNGVYQLNGDGTAFEYSSDAATIAPTSSYFITALDECARLAAILLPAVPTSLDTAVKGINADGEDTHEALYNVTGQRIGTADMLHSGKLAPGVYVRKGRTVLVK